MRANWVMMYKGSNHMHSVTVERDIYEPYNMSTWMYYVLTRATDHQNFTSRSTHMSVTGLWCPASSHPRCRSALHAVRMPGRRTVVRSAQGQRTTYIERTPADTNITGPPQQPRPSLKSAATARIGCPHGVLAVNLPHTCSTNLAQQR